MIPPAEMKLIQIIITNKCNYKCSNCSQMCPHFSKDKQYFMPLEQIEQALQSLEAYPGHIGCFGGEATMHPQFEEICKLYQKYIPVKARRELWTNGYKWKKYEKIIEDTFYEELIAFNDHEKQQPCWHQPNNIAIKDVITDNFLKNKIIENCWVQLRWSAAITPKGVYFCEVAAARANLMDIDGLSIEPYWWKRPLKDFDYQKKALCELCSMCLPMPIRPNDSQEWDDVTISMANILEKAKSPRYEQNKVRAIFIPKLREFLNGHKFEPYCLETEYRLRGGFKDFPDWTPWQYRPFECKKHKPIEQSFEGKQNE